MKDALFLIWIVVLGIIVSTIMFDMNVWYGIAITAILIAAIAFQVFIDDYFSRKHTHNEKK